MPKLRQTPSQTVGPYFAAGLSPEQYGYQQNLSSIAGIYAGVDHPHDVVPGRTAPLVDRTADVPDSVMAGDRLNLLLQRRDLLRHHRQVLGELRGLLGELGDGRVINDGKCRERA